MSVPKCRRNTSRLEVIDHSVKVRGMLTELCSRDLGIKDILHVARMNYAFGIDQREDLSKYMYEIRHSKEKLIDLGGQIEGYVRAANSIIPKFLYECKMRREFQTRALASCEQVVSELQHIVGTFKVDINSFKQYIVAIDRQEELIKKWRQADNRIRERIELALLEKGGI